MCSSNHFGVNINREGPPGSLGVESLESSHPLVIDSLVACYGGESIARADSYSKKALSLFYIGHSIPKSALATV